MIETRSTARRLYGLRSVLVCGLLSLTLSAQIGEMEEVEEEEEDVATAYVLPFVAEVHQQSYKDFKKFCVEKKWSRAFRSIGKQLEQTRGP